jgi:tetratricopeptide (TPR) repeat protein
VAYFFRALAYYHLGDPQAFTDFDRAIELNPKYAEAYYNRGLAYGHLGDHLQAIKDLKTAAKLGYTPAQDYLNSKGISW